MSSLQEEIKKLEDLRKEYHDLGEKIELQSDLVTRLNKEFEDLQNKKLTFQDSLRYRNEMGLYSELNYNFRENYIKENLNTSSYSFSFSGLNQETGQVCLELAVYKEATDDDLMELEFLLKRIFDIIEPFEDPAYIDGKKVKMVKIFEHTLCAHGIYYIVSNEEVTEFDVGFCRYRSFREPRFTTDLMSLLKTIRKNHYYR